VEERDSKENLPRSCQFCRDVAVRKNSAKQWLTRLLPVESAQLCEFLTTSLGVSPLVHGQVYSMPVGEFLRLLDVKGMSQLIDTTDLTNLCSIMMTRYLALD